MTQNSFSEDIQVLKDQIAYKHIQINILRSEYIEKYRNFSIGDKVRITLENGNQHVVYVGSIGVFDNGEIYYRLYKQKKNGAMSAHRFKSDYEIVSTEKFT